MKHDRFCAIGHNLADSMASGLGFVIGHYEMDIFGEAASSHGGLIEVDFLNGHVVRGEASDSLRTAVTLFAEVLPEFAERNGAKATDFAALSAVFYTATTGRRMSLTVTDRQGRSSITEYAGDPLKRLRLLDDLGRMRRAPRQAATYTTGAGKEL